MGNQDIRLSFEQSKNKILDKIRNSKEKWQRVWQEIEGNPDKERELIHLNLEIKIMEIQALEELEELEQEVKRAEAASE